MPLPNRKRVVHGRKSDEGHRSSAKRVGSQGYARIGDSQRGSAELLGGRRGQASWDPYLPRSQTQSVS